MKCTEACKIQDTQAHPVIFMHLYKSVLNCNLNILAVAKQYAVFKLFNRLITPSAYRPSCSCGLKRKPHVH